MKTTQIEFDLRKIRNKVEGTQAFTIRVKRAFERAQKAIDNLQDYGTNSSRVNTLLKGLRTLRRLSTEAHGASKLSDVGPRLTGIIKRVRKNS